MIRWEDIKTNPGSMFGYIGKRRVAFVQRIRETLYFAYAFSNYLGEFKSAEEAQKAIESDISAWLESAGLVVDNVCEWTPAGFAFFSGNDKPNEFDTACGETIHYEDAQNELPKCCEACRGRVVVKEEGKC